MYNFWLWETISTKLSRESLVHFPVASVANLYTFSVSVQHKSLSPSSGCLEVEISFKELKVTFSIDQLFPESLKWLIHFFSFCCCPKSLASSASKVPCGNILWLSAVISDLHLYKDHHDGPASTHLIQVTFLQT